MGSSVTPAIHPARRGSGCRLVAQSVVESDDLPTIIPRHRRAKYDVNTETICDLGSERSTEDVVLVC